MEARDITGINSDFFNPKRLIVIEMKENDQQIRERQIKEEQLKLESKDALNTFKDNIPLIEK